MTNLTAVPGFTPVPELETSTLALGGPGGPMNSQAQALLNQVSNLRFYDLTVGCTGKPAANAIIFTFKAPRPFALPTNLTGSTGIANTAATASTVFTINYNGSSMGSITFAASGTVPTFTLTAVAVDAGDVITIVAPGTQDATLADIGFTLVGAL